MKQLALLFWSMMTLQKHASWKHGNCFVSYIGKNEFRVIALDFVCWKFDQLQSSDVYSFIEHCVFV